MFVRLNHHKPRTTQTISNTISNTATISHFPPPRDITVRAYRLAFDAGKRTHLPLSGVAHADERKLEPAVRIWLRCPWSRPVGRLSEGVYLGGLGQCYLYVP